MRKIVLALLALAMAAPALASETAVEADKARDLSYEMSKLTDQACHTSKCRNGFRAVKKNLIEIGTALMDASNHIIGPMTADQRDELSFGIERDVYEAHAEFVAVFAGHGEPAPNLRRAEEIELMAAACSRGMNPAGCRADVDHVRELMMQGMRIAKSTGDSFPERGTTNRAMTSYLDAAQKLVYKRGYFFKLFFEKVDEALAKNGKNR